MQGFAFISIAVPFPYRAAFLAIPSQVLQCSGSLWSSSLKGFERRGSTSHPWQGGAVSSAPPGQRFHQSKAQGQAGHEDGDRTEGGGLGTGI